ncbi:uncharacterized protein LOC116158714 [Photinus pyralis]|nr:uncharacterized protein LOC116158714 [Photinus pyralis]
MDFVKVKVNNRTALPALSSATRLSLFTEIHTILINTLRLRFTCLPWPWHPSLGPNCFCLFIMDMDSLNSTWSVVKFPKENSVCVVPTSWIHKDKCYWPPYNDKLTRTAIEKHESFNAQTWLEFPCEPFRNATYDTFKEANRKSQIAMTTSDLESSAEAGATTVSSRKRKIFRKTFSFSSIDEENEESVLPEPPKLTIRETFERRADEPQHSSCSAASIDVECEELILPELHTANKRKENSQTRDDTMVETTMQGQTRGQSIKAISRKGDGHGQDGTQTIKYLQQIIKKQNILQSILMDISNRITNLESQNSTQTQENVDDNAESFFVIMTNLPIDSQEHLNDLEMYLSTPEHMESAVKEVSHIGGKDTYDFVFRATQKLITNNFCGSTFSFLGRRKKEPFTKLKLNELLIKSSMHLFPSATLKDVEGSITKWLRRCLERSKK